MRAKSIKPTIREYHLTVLPSLSGMMGIKRAATMGKRIMVVNQGN
jgi:hypothetical protein